MYTLPHNTQLQKKIITAMTENACKAINAVSLTEAKVLYKIQKSCLIVAAHSIAESFISYNLRLSFQEGLKSLLHRLQLLLVELRKRRQVM